MVVEDVQTGIVRMIRVIKFNCLEVFGYHFGAEYRLCGYFLPNVFVGEELELLFQVVPWLEELQIEVGHFLVQTLKEFERNDGAILIQHKKDYPLHPEE